MYKNDLTVQVIFCGIPASRGLLDRASFHGLFLCYLSVIFTSVFTDINKRLISEKGLSALVVMYLFNKCIMLHSLE